MYYTLSRVVSGEHSRSKTSTIIALALLCECSPLTTVDLKPWP